MRRFRVFLGLTVCDASQGLVEGGRVAVIGERDTHSSRQKPSGQREGLLVLEEPGPEALIVHLVTLPTRTRTHTHRVGLSKAEVALHLS